MTTQLPNTAATWAWVTGGSRGIGRACALALGEAGHHVLLTYQQQQQAADAVVAQLQQRGGQGVAAALDLHAADATISAQVDAWCEAHGTPEIFVHNAGMCHDQLFTAMRPAQWAEVLQVNLLSFHALARPLLRRMARRRSGRIIVLASVSGQTGNAGQVHYAASKAGLIAACKSLAREVGSRGITVNAVAPGYIETDMTAALPVDSLLPQIPVGRVGQPQEVAHAVCFLASAQASYITGQVLAVNGGLSM